MAMFYIGLKASSISSTSYIHARMSVEVPYLDELFKANGLYRITLVEIQVRYLLTSRDVPFDWSRGTLVVNSNVFKILAFFKFYIFFKYVFNSLL